MSHKIQFRIWNKESQSWAEDCCGTHCCSHWVLDRNGRLYDMVSDLSGKEFSPTEAKNYYFRKPKKGKPLKVIKKSPYVIQRATGLKDKAGQMIFEGDIVDYEPLADAFPFVVEFAEGAFKIDGDLLGDFNDKVKIIGNIFENKDLLK